MFYNLEGKKNEILNVKKMFVNTNTKTLVLRDDMTKQPGASGEPKGRSQPEK